jgi:signal transduction histidine kinase
VFERFRRVGLFADLREDDLARICSLARDVHLEPGEVLFREGEWGDQAFVVTAGQVEVLKSTERREVLLAVRGEDAVIGEMALLEQAPRSATVRARTATDLLSIPKEALDDLLATSPSAARAVFGPLLRRVRENNDLLRHQERMAQLGVLTAGVAHELNNPAAAVRGAAEQLAAELDVLTGSLAGRASESVRELLARVADRPPAPRSPVEISDEESEVEDWLTERRVEQAWALAPGLVEAGIGVDDLAMLGTDADVADAVRILAPAVAVRRSAAQIAEGARRLSEIVRALRSYSYLDLAPVQDVDVVGGLEDTLTMLGHITKGVRVVREFDPSLPTIVALGSELNQVWTNLIHNACDALAGVGDPTLTLRAYPDGGDVVVEVEDNGPGVPADAQQKVFDAFYTTKAPGKGTGLGLQISYRIVVLEHRGDITLASRPGRTVFTVRLPVRAPSVQDAGAPGPGPQSLCEHLLAVEDAPKPSGVCEQCLATGDDWVHLRFCTTCGQVGCCDDSANRHASRHAVEAGHPVMRSKEPGENWAWCVEHQVGTNLAVP